MTRIWSGPPPPSLRSRARAKGFHLVHQFLAIERADRWLIRDREKDPHRAIGRSERLVFSRSRRCRRTVSVPARRRRTDRAAVRFPAAASRPRFPGADGLSRARILSGWRMATRFGKRLRLEIQKQRNGDPLQIVNSLRRFDRRAGQDARAPGLLAQALGEDRRKFLQLIDVVRLADQREGQLAGLGEIAIVNLQSLDRFEPAGRRLSTSVSSVSRVTRM